MNKNIKIYLKINKMKNYFKLSFSILVSILILNSCEKAIDNSIPEGTPRREFYNNQIKEFLTNDSLWVTQVLDKGKLKFRVGFIFAKDGTTKLYNINRNPITLVQQLTEAYALQTTNANRNEINNLILTFGGFEDSQLRDILINNPANLSFKLRVEKFFPLTLKAPFGKIAVNEGTNTYGVYGDFDASLTFYNTSFLSDYKQKNEFDFDFLIKSYKRDSLSLEGYYSQNTNRFPIIKPIKFSELDTYNRALNIIVTSLGFVTELKVGGVALPSDGNLYLNTGFSEAYDDLNKNLKFKSIAGQSIDPLFNGITALKAIDVPFVAGSAKPASGTLIAKFTGYNGEQKGSLAGGVTIELLVK
jgi:hypothetical protein